MSVRRSRLLLLLPLCGMLLSPRPDSGGTVVFPSIPRECLHNIKTAPLPGGGTAYAIKDLSYRRSSDPLITDIVLSFDTPSRRLVRDDTRHYRVTASDYTFTTGSGALGKGCARFFKKEHGVTVETTRGAWLGTCDDLGSFTIEFRFMPYELRDGSVLFSRVGYVSGTKRGIEVTISNGSLVAGLYGIFDRPERTRYDVVLRRGRALTKMKWHHFSLSFDRLSGKLTKYLDGEEDEVTHVTESGEAYNGVYAPSFGYRNTDGTLHCVDAPPASIGRNYAGLIDEFRISYRHFENLEKTTALAYRNYRSVGRIGRIPYNVEGVITSPVYRFAGTGTKVQEFRWKDDTGADTFVWMEFRIADHSFRANDIDLKWYRVENNQKKIFLARQGDGEFLRGRYYQWRAHLVASPDGTRSPKLSHVELDYRLDYPPNPPLMVEVVSSGDRIVVLRWKKNVDHDIMGYRIYYGITPGRYDGIITTAGGARLTNAMGTGNFVQVTVTNDIIDENRGRDRFNRLQYPLLQNTVLYYFSVSAYDSYKPDTAYNHESELSAPVTARPYQGSEIK